MEKRGSSLCTKQPQIGKEGKHIHRSGVLTLTKNPKKERVANVGKRSPGRNVKVAGGKNPLREIFSTNNTPDGSTNF